MRKNSETSWLFFPDDHVSRDNTDQLTISRGLRAGLQQGWFQHMAWEPGWKRLLRFSNDQRAKLGDCFRKFGLGKGLFSSSNIKPSFWKFIDLRMLTIWEPLYSHLYFIKPTLWRVSLERAQGFCLGKLLKNARNIKFRWLFERGVHLMYML